MAVLIRIWGEHVHNSIRTDITIIAITIPISTVIGVIVIVVSSVLSLSFSVKIVFSVYFFYEFFPVRFIGGVGREKEGEWLPFIQIGGDRDTDSIEEKEEEEKKWRRKSEGGEKSKS